MLDAPTRETTLSNGIRIVTEHVPHFQSVSIGLRVDAGARDESDDQAGITHLLEHMVFKGTERRTAQDIAEEMDTVGGHLDAYTTREYTGYGARVLPQDVPLALDILADMLRCSLLDPNELELEKRVILEEYKSLEDSPEEYVHEVFSRTLWPDHPLGRPVIGDPEVVARLSRADLIGYINTHYVPRRLIIAAAGSVEHERFVAEIEKQFGDLRGDGINRSLSPPVSHFKSEILSRQTEQAHFCMGGEAPDESDPDRWAARVINLVLGGGMSSRLFQEVREKRGLCYSIASEMVSYREGGVFVVYADTSPKHLEEVRDLCRQELLNAAQNGLTAEELLRAKNQVRASLLLSLDDVGSRMNRLARSLLYYNRIIPSEELLAYVDAVTLEDCRRVSHRLFGSGEFAYAAIGPFKKKRTRA